MTKTKKRTVSVLLAVLLLVGVSIIPAAADGTQDIVYTYVLLPVSDGAADGTAILDLYVSVSPASGSVDPSNPAGPPLDSGAFGLRFPSWVQGCTFSPSSEIMLYKLVPDDRYTYVDGSKEIWGEGYHAFAWTGDMAVTPDGTIENTWGYNDKAGGHSIKLGTYTFTLPEKADGGYTLPASYEVGQLNWLDAKESIPLELGETAPNGSDLLNKTIWNPDTGLYQGYYADENAATAEDALLIQTDIGFRFTAPSTWASVLTVLSYDPKEPVTAQLYGPDGALVATLSAATYSGSDEAGTVYALNDSQKNTGLGAYYTAVRLDQGFYEAGQSVHAGATYTLKLSKAGHLTCELTLLAKSDVIAGAEGFPESGKAIYLPAGDLNGNQRIDMADRALLFGAMKSASDADLLEVADLDGDDRVTMADLSILTSPKNYTKTLAYEVTK